MRRIPVVIGGGLLVFAFGSTTLAQWSPLQADDRGAPRYTTGNTMGREGGQSGVSSHDPASDAEIARDRRAREAAQDRPTRAEPGTPGPGKRGIKRDTKTGR